MIEGMFSRYLVATVQPTPFKILCAFCTAGLNFLFPARTWVTLLVVVVFCAVDLVSGISASWMAGEKIESGRMKRSAVKLTLYGALVLVASLLPVAFVDAGLVPIPVELRAGLLGGVLAYLAGTEALSIVENVRKAGIAIPPVLVRFIEGRLKATPEPAPSEVAS